MFYKIPLDADLTNTSYRCKKETEEAAYIEYNEGAVFDEWEEIDEATAREIAPEWFTENEEKPTEEEIFNAEMRAGMEEIKERQNAQDKKLLDILLNITGESDTAEDEVTSVEFMAMVEGVL